MSQDAVEFDAIILAGGQARRFGADKLGVPIQGVGVLDRCLAGLVDARRRIVVGPRRQTDATVTWTREDPPGGGPVPAIAAGLALAQAEWVAVVAGDMPWVRPAVRLLVNVATGALGIDAAVAVDEAGQPQPLAAVWRRERLVDVVATVLAGRQRSAMALLARAAVAFVGVKGNALVDIDVPEDIERYRS